MSVLRVHEHSPYRQLVGVGGLGTGIFFALEGNHTLGRNESRSGRLLDVRDYCKLHIVMHYVAKLLGAGRGSFQVLPLGKVGSDAAGELVLGEMRAAGIDTRYVEVVAGKPTLFSVCFQYGDGCGGNITTSNSAAAELSTEDISRVSPLLRAAGPRTIALLVPEVSLEVRRHFLERATQAGAFRAASFTSAEIEPARQQGMFEQLDLVSLNEEETAQLAGEPFSESQPELFLNHCVDLLCGSFPELQVVMSAGRRGAYAITRNGWSHSPAPRVKVASTAGAGDCLLGGILAALVAGIPLCSPGSGTMSPAAAIEDALGFGVLLASYKVTSPHTIHPGASLAALLDFAGAAGIRIGSSIREQVTQAEPATVAEPARTGMRT